MSLLMLSKALSPAFDVLLPTPRPILPIVLTAPPFTATGAVTSMRFLRTAPGFMTAFLEGFAPVTLRARLRA